LEPEFLQHARQVLKAGGILVVNCVSRAVEPYKAAVKALQVGCLLTDAEVKPCKPCICSNAYAYVSQPQNYY
jgi:spermidine synthase